MKIHNVSTAAELAAALSAATGGDIISLAPGNYGGLSITGKNYTSFVTIRSANSAVFTSVNITSCSFIQVDGVHVSNPSDGSSASTIVSIVGCANVQLLNSEVHGPINSNYLGHYAVYVKDSDRITVSGNNIHDAWHGCVFYPNTNLVVSDNFIDKTGSDGMKFIGVHDFLIENNTHGGNFFPPAGTHVDYIQFQGLSDSSDGVIRGNVFLSENFAYAQGIFLKDATYDNILIEQNIIHTAMGNGIKIGVGSGNTIRNNTIIHLDDPNNSSTYITSPAGSVVSGNILSKTPPGGLIGGDLHMQITDPGGAYHHSKFFKNAGAGLGITLEDLRPVAGSLGETMGAFARWAELVDGVAPPPVEPPIEPPVEPPIEPTPETGMIYTSGPHAFDGNTSSAVVVPHDPTFEIAAGSIELRLTPLSLSARAGILSKDASGFVNGGHVGILAEQGNLVVRLQSTSATYNADVAGVIVPDIDVHVVLTFGPGGMNVYVNGLLANHNPHTGGLLGNTEPMCIGANIWGSAAGTSEPMVDPFNGTIDLVSIYDKELTETEIGILAGIIVEQTPEERIAELEAEVAALTSQLEVALLEIVELNARISAAQAALEG